MKEIRAYVRPGPLAHIVDRLEADGARVLAVNRVAADELLRIRIARPATETVI